jgi:hypothetical protein
MEPELIAESVVVQCVCGKLKQRNFICDFCFSTEDTQERTNDQ